MAFFIVDLELEVDESLFLIDYAKQEDGHREAVVQSPAQPGWKSAKPYAEVLTPVCEMNEFHHGDGCYGKEQFVPPECWQREVKHTGLKYARDKLDCNFQGIGPEKYPCQGNEVERAKCSKPSSCPRTKWQACP